MSFYVNHMEPGDRSLILEYTNNIQDKTILKYLDQFSTVISKCSSAATNAYSCDKPARSIGASLRLCEEIMMQMMEDICHSAGKKKRILIVMLEMFYRVYSVFEFNRFNTMDYE